MSKLKIMFLFFFLFLVAFYKVNSVNAIYQVRFTGCNSINCENAGYYMDGEWQGIICDSEVAIDFPDDVTEHSKVAFPSCEVSGFKGWILKARSAHDYGNYVVVCDDDSNEMVKLFSKCKNKHIFNNLDFMVFNISVFAKKGYDSFYFDAVIDGKVLDEYNNSDSITDVDYNEEILNYNENSVVQCGPNLLKDIPALLPWLVHFIYLLLQLAVPILLVIFGTIDFLVSIVQQKDDGIKSGQRKFISRIVAGVIVFFVFSIIKILISLIGDENNTKIVNCVDCFINNNNSCIR